MKEDYLWDKTGEADAEIARMEIALQAFKYRESAPPALTLLNVLPFKKETACRRRQVRFALAMAACLLFGAIAFAAWFQILRKNIEANQPRAETTQPQTDLPAASREEIKQVAADRQTAGNPANPAVKKFVKPKKSFVRTIFRTRKPAATAPNQLVALRKIKPAGAAAQPKVRLTEEERYAYNQLMLALSITTSKLKMVRDKVEGSDTKKAL